MAAQDTSIHSSSDVPPELARSSCPLPEAADDDRTSRHVAVVGDRFAQFADGERVLTMSDLLVLVSSDAADVSGCAWVVHVGQGIEKSDWQILQSVRGVNGSSVVRIADRESLLGSRVAPGTVHKVHPENVLLANVRNLSKGHCVADLRIHRDNELIIDHRTGEHVQGMVIIEAMRQICIAQFETDYRPDLPSDGYAGIWRRINLGFQGFLFALPATVVSEIVAENLSRPANLRFRARTCVWQNGGEVASADIEYAMITQKRFETLERRKAAWATQTYLTRFAGQYDVG
jgi:hypothetical protein